MSRAVDPSTHQFSKHHNHDTLSDDRPDVNFPGQLQATHIDKNYGIVISVIQVAGPDAAPGPVVQVNYPRHSTKRRRSAMSVGSTDSESEPEAETASRKRKKSRICQLCGYLQDRGLGILREGRVPQDSHRDNTSGRSTHEDVGEVVPDSETEPEPEERAPEPAKASPRKRR
ncbi:hypothetical protein K474DRAFT_1710912 [Panus rudis PR-1116 ss-1]|nr:hypothetical protein K474DRAFT_1710912 [Panus rudis PR-1116 ss-1]